MINTYCSPGRAQGVSKIREEAFNTIRKGNLIVEMKNNCQTLQALPSHARRNPTHCIPTVKE